MGVSDWRFSISCRRMGHSERTKSAMGKIRSTSGIGCTLGRISSTCCATKNLLLSITMTPLNWQRSKPVGNRRAKQNHYEQILPRLTKHPQTDSVGLLTTCCKSAILSAQPGPVVAGPGHLPQRTAEAGTCVMTEYKIAKNTERHDSMSGALHRT